MQIFVFYERVNKTLLHLVKKVASPTFSIYCKEYGRSKCKILEWLHMGYKNWKIRYVRDKNRKNDLKEVGGTLWIWIC